MLKFAPQAASEPVCKVLRARSPTPEHKRTSVASLDERELVITEAFVDEGPTLKRFRPRAQGRAYRIRKRTSHITVIVLHPDPVERPAKRAEKAAAKKTAEQAAQDVRHSGQEGRCESAEAAPAEQAAPAKKAAAKKPPKSAEKSAESSKGSAR